MSFISGKIQLNYTQMESYSVYLFYAYKNISEEYDGRMDEESTFPFILNTSVFYFFEIIKNQLGL